MFGIEQHAASNTEVNQNFLCSWLYRLSFRKYPSPALPQGNIVRDKRSFHCCILK